MKGIIDFGYREFGEDGYINRKHLHGKSYEILQIWSGEGVVIAKNNLYPIKKGAIYFINGMEIHCSALKNARDYIRSKIVISGSFIDSVLHNAGCDVILQDLFFKNGGSMLSPDSSDLAALDEEFLSIKDNLAGQSLYSRLNITMSVLKILQLSHSNINRAAPALVNKVSGILKYIDRNIDQKISLAEIEENFHCSKYYLCHIFKETTGMTITDYILSKRIAAAKKRLAYTNDPLSLIAMECGFSSFAYFSKIFKEKNGLSPRDFRKMSAYS